MVANMEGHKTNFKTFSLRPTGFIPLATSDRSGMIRDNKVRSDHLYRIEVMCHHIISHNIMCNRFPISQLECCLQNTLFLNEVLAQKNIYISLFGTIKESGLLLKNSKYLGGN